MADYSAAARRVSSSPAYAHFHRKRENEQRNEETAGFLLFLSKKSTLTWPALFKAHMLKSSKLNLFFTIAKIKKDKVRCGAAPRGSRSMWTKGLSLACEVHGNSYCTLWDTKRKQTGESKVLRYIPKNLRLSRLLQLYISESAYIYISESAYMHMLYIFIYAYMHSLIYMAAADIYIYISKHSLRKCWLVHRAAKWISTAV